VWWFTSVIPALSRVWQEDLKFEANLGYPISKQQKIVRNLTGEEKLTVCSEYSTFRRPGH
jgi:hypothetical protein